VSKLPELVIGDLKIYPPIIQGGMGVRISMEKLAVAVANQGAVGTISAAFTSGIKSLLSISDIECLSERELIAHIRKAKTLTQGILAVNIMVALLNYPLLVKTSSNEGIDIIFSGAGLPLNLPKLIKETKTKIVPIVSSARTAEIICKTWIRKYNYVPDAIVLEGPMAGGHLGFSMEDLENEETMPKLEKLLVEVIGVAEKYGKENNKNIPVIPAGGIYDGKDIARMLKLGASGVQLATRFVCTHECDAPDVFKQAYLNAKKEDLIIINSPVGMPGRAIKNEFLEKAKRGEIKFNCFYQCLKTCIPSKSPYCIANALISAADGDLENGFVFAGSNAYRCDKIVSVKELMDELVKEAEEAYT
jgi:NAD(P)H-dependent flavin oxidoreductase YrpB (nitropropane dioxygenase family)